MEDNLKLKVGTLSTPLPPPPIVHQCEVHISNVISRIDGVLPESFWEALSFAMSYEVPGAYFSSLYQNRHWDGRKKLLDRRRFSFPTGLFSIFKEVCRNNGVGYTVVDQRIKPTHGSLLPIKKIELFEYQKQSVQTALSKQRGMVRVATGGGKTEIICGIISQTNLPTVVFIHKQDIFHQLVERLSKRLGISIGRIGCGIVYPQHITVAMIQTAYRAYGGTIKDKTVDKDVTVIPKPEIITQCIERAQCVIIDEAHHTSSDIFNHVLTRCSEGFYRFGFTASPWREDNADLLLDAHTGPKCVDISASTLIKLGYLAKPTIHLFSFDHNKAAGTNYASFYSQQVVQNLDRNKIIVQAALKAVSSNKTCLIAVTRVEHGNILEAMLKEVLPSVRFACGNVDSAERKQILEDLDKRKLSVVVATTVFGEGIDCPSLDILINAKAAQSSIDSYQLVGRVIRKTPTKNTATVIDIYDEHCKYLSKHAKKRKDIYSTEPEFIINRVDTLDKITF